MIKDADHLPNSVTGSLPSAANIRVQRFKQVFAPAVAYVRRLRRGKHTR